MALLIDYSYAPEAAAPVEPIELLNFALLTRPLLNCLLFVQAARVTLRDLFS